MIEEALDWAAAELGTPVTAVDELTGGMTSTMLRLTDATGRRTVLRVVDREPWHRHRADLTTRERDALLALADSDVPAPHTLALDAERGAHLMTHLPGVPRTEREDPPDVEAMADVLARIHAVPRHDFRTFQSWAWEATWVVPAWSRHPESWRAAFGRLADPAPAYVPTFLQRDFGHRNLLWADGRVSGVVDWVETSTGPAWLDAAHAATNLAIGYGAEPARALLSAYAERAAEPPDPYWLVLDVVGFLPPPGQPPMFGEPAQLARLDAWLHEVVGPGSARSRS